MIKTVDLWKVYTKSAEKVQALKGINLTIRDGEFLAILGPSGSGKTTLLNCLSGIDAPTRGQIFVDEIAFHTLTESEKASIRSKRMGFVFQFFNLIPVLTAVENVELPLMILGSGRKKAREKALDVLKKVGLSNRANSFPAELSGGEQQRVAIARAIVHNPQILWADEPTGALDSETGEKIIALLEHLRNEQSITLVIVTHDERIANKADRVLLMRDGLITV